MQTIIYTNCKRQAANYEVDKICFTDRVDMGQLIQEEMKKYNIRNIHFWMITNNISNIQSASQQKLMAEVAKYFADNKNMSFQVQYFVQKYVSYFQSRFNKKYLENGIQFQEIKKHKTTINLTSAHFSKYFPIPEQLYRKSQQNEFQLSKSRLVQQLIKRQSLKQPTLEQFQDFVRKQSKILTDSDSIKKYIFTTLNQSITISFIQSHKKSLIKKIIEQDCDKFYDAKLGIKKSIFQSNHKYDDLFEKCSKSMTQTLYNKVILFLILTEKNQPQTVARRRTKNLQNKINPSIQALDQWKIKEENVDIIRKLEKECDLIKQQIENQKIIFKNKVKVIENFIGQAINIEKLIQEEDIQSSNHLMMLTSQKKPTFHKIDPIAPLQVQPQGTPIRFSVNNTYITSQFKRLKDISDAMRNIDNTLLQQSKNIQTAQNRIKELIKNKQSIIYTNAVDLNRLRQVILQAKSEIARKEIQIAEIQKNGTITQIQNYKSKQPSNNVKMTLQKYQQFCNNIKIVNNQVPTQEFVSTKLTNKIKLKINTRKFITHKSLHCSSFKKSNLSQLSVNPKLKDKRMQEAQECQSRLKKQIQLDFYKIEKKIKKELMFGHQSLNENIEYTQNENQNIIKIQKQIKIQKLYQQLVGLFEYYNKNNEVEKEMKTQLQNYKVIKQQPLNSFMKETTNQVQNFSHLTKKNLHFNWNSCDTSENQLQLEDFPILKQYILQELEKKTSITQSDCLNRHKSGKIFKQQLKYPRDCFQLMLYGKKKQKNTEILMKTVTSIKSQLYDKMIEEPSQKATIDKNPPIKHPGKQKRITIQQAIKLSSHFNPHKNK